MSRASNALDAIGELLALTSAIESNVRADEARAWLATLADDVLQLDLRRNAVRKDIGPKEAGDRLRESCARLVAEIDRFAAQACAGMVTR